MGRSFPLDYLSLEWLSLGVEAGGRRRLLASRRSGGDPVGEAGRGPQHAHAPLRRYNQDSCFGITPNTKTYISVYPLLDT